MAERPELFLISMAASLLEMHPQTLRKYERLGLVRPARVSGSARVYTRAELERVRLIKTLVEDEGINLAGVQRLLSIADVARRLGPLVRNRNRRDMVEVHRRIDAEIETLFRLLGIDDTGD